MLINDPNTILLVKPAPKIEKIYEGCYSEIYQQIKEILSPYHEIKPLILPDIWIRDFAPFFTYKGAISLLYRPPYQSFSKSKEIQFECLKLWPENLFIPQIRFDGGNLIMNKNGVGIATKKGLELNRLSQKEMNEALKKLFGIRKIFSG